MPLFLKQTINATTDLLVWKITEDVATLFQNTPLRDVHLARFEKMLSDTHRCGFLSVRHLLKAAGYSDLDLFYDENGKPHLSDGNHISISHSFGFSTIIISAENVGVDIEMQREKIIRIADKFIGSEAAFLSTENQSLYIKNLSVIWGAKEALFKMCNSRSLSFKQDMHIQPFNLDETVGDAYINCHMTDFSKKFHFHFKEIDNYTLVYALEKES